jgi:hypothetical protein
VLPFLPPHLHEHLRYVSLVRSWTSCPLRHTIKPYQSVCCCRVLHGCRSFTTGVDDDGEVLELIKADFRQSCTDDVYVVHW